MKSMNSFKPIFLFVCLFSLPLSATELTTASPEDVGMSSDVLNTITETMQGYVDDGIIPGVYTLITRRGHIVFDEVVGTRGIHDERPLTRDALFRIYSMTKPITAVAAMQLYEQGHWQLEDPITKFLPELADVKVMGPGGELVDLDRPVTMRHLMTHTAGFSYVFNARRDPVARMYITRQLLGQKNLEEFMTLLSTFPLAFQPGSRWYYSIAVDITGLIVQRISGQPFDEYLDEHVFTPLKMDDTFFNIPFEKVDRLIPTNGWNRTENKLVENPGSDSESYRPTQFFSGGGGLISTGMDFLRFAEAIRRGGILDGERILKEETVALMTSNHLPQSISPDVLGEDPALAARVQSQFGFGLGFGVNVTPPSETGFSSLGEYSWGGAAGTVFWVNPVEDIVVVGMIQRMGGGVPLRQDLHQAIVNSVVTIEGE